MADDKTNLLSKQYELVDVKRDNVPLAQFLGDKTKLRLTVYQSRFIILLVVIPARKRLLRQP